MWIDDHLLDQSHQDLSYHCFVPRDPVVVMARSNPKADCHWDYCQSHGIEVLRRLGGGGAVVLYPGCVVISAGLWVDRPFDNPYFFHCFNATIIELFEQHFPITELYEDGISDLVFAGKKWAGSSLFRSKNYLLYQGSLLVDVDEDLISNCLAHPAREPNYRQGKSHKDFLTGISDICHGQGALRPTPQQVRELCEQRFMDLLTTRLSDCLRPPEKSHVRFIKARIADTYPRSFESYFQLPKPASLSQS